MHLVNANECDRLDGTESHVWQSIYTLSPSPVAVYIGWAEKMMKTKKKTYLSLEKFSWLELFKVFQTKKEGRPVRSYQEKRGGGKTFNF